LIPLENPSKKMKLEGKAQKSWILQNVPDAIK